MPQTNQVPEKLEAELVVFGGTPSGILASVRAAREGLSVVLVSVFPHVGGTLTNGLGSWDTQYNGKRSPLVDEWVDRVLDHYRDTYGLDSAQYRDAIDGPFAAGPWKHMMFEPHVAELVFEQMLAEQDGIRVIRGFELASVERAGRIIRSITVSPMTGEGHDVRVAGATFIDASYECDLGAFAGADYRVGRESRAEFDEQHAGRLFMQRSGSEADFPEHGQIERLKYPRDAAAGLLDIRPHWGVTQEIFSQSSGEGDGAVQAYNYRVTLSKNPDNRIPIEAPEGYTRERFLPITEQDPPHLPPKRYAIKTDLIINPLKAMPAKLPLPNRKCDWNAAAIPGGVDDYPDGDWQTRHRIMREHQDFALGLLYFLQHDESVPQNVREESLEWGLPADEFTDNGNFPYEFYVREGRRPRGRSIFTENDARFAVGLDRAPIHGDSVAIAEWLLDSHDCSTERVIGSYGDGWTTLSELTRPSQVSYGTMLPKELDNLLYSVCVSATHCGWGTLRVEPVWMHLGDVAGFAAVAAARGGTTVGELAADELQRTLVRNRVLITFFNFFDVAGDEPWIPAVQYFGTKGFFASYDLRPHDPVTVGELQEWVRIMGSIAAGAQFDPGEVGRRMKQLASSAGDATHASAAALIGAAQAELAYRTLRADTTGIAARMGLDGERVSRAQACQLLFEVLNAAG